MLTHNNYKNLKVSWITFPSNFI